MEIAHRPEPRIRHCQGVRGKVLQLGGPTEFSGAPPLSAHDPRQLASGLEQIELSVAAGKDSDAPVFESRKPRHLPYQVGGVTCKERPIATAEHDLRFHVHAPESFWRILWKVVLHDLDLRRVADRKPRLLQCSIKSGSDLRRNWDRARRNARSAGQDQVDSARLWQILDRKPVASGRDGFRYPYEIHGVQSAPKIGHGIGQRLLRRRPTAGDVAWST